MPKKKNKSIEEEILENRKTKKEEQENIEVDIVKPKLKHRVFSFNKTFDNLKIKYKKDPKKFIVLAASILVAFSLVIGSSYAYLTYISKTNSITTIEAGTLALNFKNETNSISLNNALPIKDEEGLEGKEEYEFTIENTGSLPASYVITLDNTCVAGKSYTIDGTSINADICIPINYIKVGLKEGSSDYKVLEYNESESQYIIDAGSLNSNGTKTYKMKLWLDYDTPNDYNSHGTLDVIFSAKLGLSYEQGVTVLESASEMLMSKVGTDGIVAEEHTETTQLQANTDYRYTGVDPNNYVSFNNELWRIIGVFPTEDVSGKIENRVKIIRDESIGNIPWDDSNYVNDWSTSSLQTLLNSGDYYNRTGEFSTTGLTEEAKSMISDAKWYLGGTENHTSSSNGLTSHFYTYERGTTVYSGNPTNWIGKVGLMYPSDYGYATSGGTTTKREACLAKELVNWPSSSDCYNNDWLYDSSDVQWTITSYSGEDYFVFFASDNIRIDLTSSNFTVRPVLYLSSDAQITGGVGTSSDPYTLGI